MNSATWWIMAAISFFVSMVMSALCMFINNANVTTVLVMLELGLVISGWVLWAIGLVSYLRRR